MSDEKAAAEHADANGKAFCPDCFRAGIMNCSEFDVCGWDERFQKLLGREPRILAAEREVRSKQGDVP